MWVLSIHAGWIVLWTITVLEIKANLKYVLIHLKLQQQIHRDRK